MSKFKICIDCGHYGKYNQSPVLKEYYESIFAWELGQLMRKYFLEYDVEVIMTRNNINKDLALYNRGALSKGCDLFISLHSNASSSSKTDYTVVFYGFNEPTTKDLGIMLSKKIGEIINTSQSPQILTKKSSLREDEYYGVLRGARAVGTKYRYIIEHSFHTNLQVAKFLLNNSNIDLLARSEVDIIVKYFKLDKKDTGKNMYARVIIENLNVRSIPDWSAKPCQIVKYGDVFTVDSLVSAKNGSTKMYKLKSGLYITSAVKYVETFYK